MQAHARVQPLLLLSLLTATLLPMVQCQPGWQVVRVRTGQELADAVALWGGLGNNMTIQIEVPFISVRNATFTYHADITNRTGSQSFSEGTLIIKGSVDSLGHPNTTLDTAMRDGLTQTLSGTATMELQDLILINLCEDGTALPGVQGFSYPWGVYLFLANLLYTARTFRNLWMYGRQASMELIAYYILVQAVTDPAVHNVTASVLDVSGLSGELGAELTPFSADINKFFSLDTNVYNVTIKAVENPDDPLIAQLRSQGVLMPAQPCNWRTKIVDLETQRLVAPFWMSVLPSTFESKLAEAAAYTATPRLLAALPVTLLLVGDSVTVPETASYKVSSRLLLLNNRINAFPFWDQMLIIDLNQRVNLMNIMPGAAVMFQWVGLTGIAVQVPTRVPHSLAGKPLLPSAFPLAAFNLSAGPDAWNRTSQVVLSRVMIAIPPADYLALFILTSSRGMIGLPACADPTLAQRIAQLQAGISSWQDSSAEGTPLDQHLQQQAPELVLSSLVGWGMRADTLRLVPTSSLQEVVCQPSQLSSPARARVLGLAFGITCGSALLLAALIVVVVRARRERRQAAAALSITSSQQSQSEKAGTADHLSTSNSAPATVLDQSGASSATPSLLQFMQQLRAFQEQVFASLAASPGNEAAAGVANEAPQAQDKAVDKRALQGQVEELAGKLQETGDQLVLAGVLGAGSGGTVYMGLWRGLRVAVKTVIFHVSVNMADGEEHIPNQRIILETAICASLGHRNVVATYHYDIKALVTKPGTPSDGGLQINMTPSARPPDRKAYKLFLIQELCNANLGTALNDGLLLNENTSTGNMRAILVVLLDIACGLEYLHSKGIIHGDLKPENVLLKIDLSTSEGVVAKLADFGLSAKLLPGQTHVSNYRSGTPFYVAPEVAVSCQLSPASDLYSFGVVMWQLFMQQRPYIVTAEGGFQWDPLFPSFPPGRMPSAQFVLLSHRCLQHNPQLRPSASEAIDNLKFMLVNSKQ